MTALRRDHRGIDSAPGPSAGRVGHRRALPTGRAVAGGFFVAAAVIVVFAAWLAGSGRSGRPWVVAVHDLPAGARVAAGDLGTERMTLPASGTARLAFSDPAAVVGRVLDAPVRAGQLLQVGDLAAGRSAAALRPVTVAVDPTDVSGMEVGTVVDVLVTDGSDPASPTAVVATGARVLAVGRPAGSLVAGATGAQLTLGVSTLGQVTGIVHAAHTGTLSVVVGAPGDVATPGAGTSRPPVGSVPVAGTGASSTGAGG